MGRGVSMFERDRSRALAVFTAMANDVDGTARPMTVYMRANNGTIARVPQ